jgi:hypothetical protein
MHKLKHDFAVPEFSNVIRVALILTALFSSAHTRAMCIAPVVPKGTDPAKAEVQYAVDTSEAVFSGEVTALEYVPAATERGAAEMLIVRMAARTWWKGAGTDEVTLNTSQYRYPDGMTSFEAHDYLFELGRTYLVYASAYHGGLATSICARTKPVEEAAQDILLLDTLTRHVTDHGSQF